MNVQMVRRYAREGRIPAYKLPGGRAFKFFRDEIFEFVKAHPVTIDDVATATTSKPPAADDRRPLASGESACSHDLASPAIATGGSSRVRRLAEAGSASARGRHGHGRVETPRGWRIRFGGGGGRR